MKLTKRFDEGMRERVRQGSETEEEGDGDIILYSQSCVDI